MKSILDRSFRYTPSFDTDLNKTFAKVRRDRKDEVEAKARVPELTLVNVSPIVRKAVAGK